ncbi:MAG: DUF368 domain-containing protein [Myxococcota bacterium]|nr:DUF368 domain-containing protein [Myxococcota bacterium]
MTAWFKNALRGVCMGIADVIPGVSGGTLALILGIYQRFVGSISVVGPGMVRALLSGAFWSRLRIGLTDPEALGEDQTDSYATSVLFLASLGAGIVGAILIGARFIPDLLAVYPAQMKGFFFGLVLASVSIPYRHMTERKLFHGVALVLAIVGAYTLTGLSTTADGRATGEVKLTISSPTGEAVQLSAASVTFLTDRHEGAQDKREVAFGPTSDLTIPSGTTALSVPVNARMTGVAADIGPNELKRAVGLPDGVELESSTAMTGGKDPSLLFIFIAGVVAISAMVLPGLSGSFILLILGLYHFMTYTLRAAVYDLDPEALPVVAVFCVALAIGITGFSRVLRRLFESHHDLTMAILVGLMLGSLRKLWPYTATLEGGREVNVAPSSTDETLFATLACFAVGAVLVTGLERLGRTASNTVDRVSEEAGGDVSDAQPESGADDQPQSEPGE